MSTPECKKTCNSVVRKVVESRGHIQLNGQEGEFVLLREVDEVLEANRAIKGLRTRNARNLIARKRGKRRTQAHKENFREDFCRCGTKNYRTKIFWFGGIFDFREKGKT